MSSGGPLAGVVVFVDVTNEGGLNATSLFSKKLASLGALVVERLSRAVTHVVFKGAPDALRALHDRLAKLGAGAHRHVVSVAWVVACEASRAKAEEGAHAQVRPADTLASLVASPTYVRGGGGSSKKRKSMAPQPVQRYGACGPHTLRWSAQTHSSHSGSRSCRPDLDLENPAFSSSQLLLLRSPALDGSGAGGTPGGNPLLLADVGEAGDVGGSSGEPSTRIKRARSVLGPARVQPRSAPASLGPGAGGGGSPPAGETFSPLRPHAALQLALLEAASARADTGGTPPRDADGAPEAVAEAALDAPADVRPAARSPLAPALALINPMPMPPPLDAAKAAVVSAVARRGTLAVTCADAALADCAASAVSTLRGLRLCPFAGSGVTHLVLGEPKRTLKVLHAVARGAWLLRPEWLLRSLEAGAWLPEGDFEDGAFAGAPRARLARANPEHRGLLVGVRVLVAEPRRAAPPASDLRALVLACGGAVVKKGACDYVVTAKGQQPSADAKAAKAVTEQWLLDAIAEYQLPADAGAYAP